MIKITARMNGFRRCGVIHAGTKEYSDDRWTPEQLGILRAEPMLIVEEIPEEKGAQENTQKGGSAAPAAQGFSPESEGDVSAPQGESSGPGSETGTATPDDAAATPADAAPAVSGKGKSAAKAKKA